MIRGRKLVVVLPAYNAASTLARTYRAIPGVVDEVLLVDDASHDRTIEVAQALGIPWRRHARNRGYGANQKTCYAWALERGADVVVMLHPDDQYPAEAIPRLAELVAAGTCDVALGSRVARPGAIARGMPIYKYACNRLWSWGQNLALGQRLSEYHTGLRAYSRRFLQRAPLAENDDGFLFDNQALVQAVYFDYAIGEIAVEGRYPADASTISPWRGVGYGLGIVATTVRYGMQRAGLLRSAMFDPDGRRLAGAPFEPTRAPIADSTQAVADLRAHAVLPPA